MSGSVVQVHAALQLLAFLVFFPLGSIFALYRESIGSSWFIFHVTFQTLGTLSVAIAVALIVSYARKERRAKPDPKAKAKPESLTKRLHRANGYLLVSVLALQWVWALVMRRYVDWGIWLTTHMTLAGLLLVLGIIQITLGIIMFSAK